MLPQEIIRLKRDGKALNEAQIAEFIAGVTDKSVTDAQIAAFAMAVFFQGMSSDEIVSLTLAMRDSGDVLDWSGIDRPVIDKHSTGGVGDNVSLMLAPIVAACGLAVPMISGRGLGHTGGTLDKMESIPGYSVAPDNALFRKVTQEIGCAIIGQTSNLAPADKRIYAVRDVTSTVEHIALITASILSKKLAAGLGWLVLDVKFGNGAFMDSLPKARELAQSLVRVANQAGTRTTALLTDMNETLASAIGNAVEVKNAVDYLTGAHRDPRLDDVVLSLAAEMIAVAGVSKTPEAARKKAQAALDDGRAAEIFGKMVHALGGPADFVEKPDLYLKPAPLTRPLIAKSRGYVSAMDARQLGLAVVELGGGRTDPAASVDHSVGMSAMVAKGAFVEKGDALCLIHARSEDDLARAAATVQSALVISDDMPERRAVVAERISA